ncbi:MAG: hypothetical protein JXA46_07480 [Dehalococcoidales bacterium]|nr:hypothetical protein [Dehalococcoidales bacterium]
MSEKMTMSIPEFAKAAGIGRSLAYDLARRDALPVKTIHLGGRLVVSRLAWEKLLNEQRVEHKPGATD